MDSEMSFNSGPFISFHLQSGLLKPIAKLNTSFLYLCQVTVTIISHATVSPPCEDLEKGFLKCLEAQEESCLAWHQVIQEVNNLKACPFPRLSGVVQAKAQEGRKCFRQEGLCLQGGSKLRGVRSMPRDSHKNSLSLC